MIAVNDTGITISNGQGATITLTGPSVTVNLGGVSSDVIQLEIIVWV